MFQLKRNSNPYSTFGPRPNKLFKNRTARYGSVHMIAAPVLSQPTPLSSKVLFTHEMNRAQFNDAEVTFKAKLKAEGLYDFVYPPLQPYPSKFNRPDYPEVTTEAEFEAKPLKDRRVILKDVDTAKDKYDTKKGKAWNILLEAIQPESDIYILMTPHILTSDTPGAMQTIINHFRSPRIDTLENELNQVLFQLPEKFRHASQNATTVKAIQNSIKRVDKDLKAIDPTRGLTKATMLTTMTNCLHGDMLKKFIALKLDNEGDTFDELVDRLYRYQHALEDRAKPTPTTRTPLVLNTFIGKRKSYQSHDNSLPNPVLKRHYHGPRSTTNRPQFKNNYKPKFFKSKNNFNRKVYPSHQSHIAVPKHLRRKTSKICNRCKKPGHLAKNCRTRLGNYARHMRANHVSFAPRTKPDETSEVHPILRETSDKLPDDSHAPVRLFYFQAVEAPAEDQDPILPPPTAEVHDVASLAVQPATTENNADDVDFDLTDSDNGDNESDSGSSLPDLIAVVTCARWYLPYSNLTLEAVILATRNTVYVRFRHRLVFGIEMEPVIPQPHGYASCFAEELPGPIIAFGHDDAMRPLFPLTGPFLFDNTNPYDELEALGINHPFNDEELATRRAAYNDAHAIIHYLEQVPNSPLPNQAGISPVEDLLVHMQPAEYSFLPVDDESEYQEDPQDNQTPQLMMHAPSLESQTPPRQPISKHHRALRLR